MSHCVKFFEIEISHPIRSLENLAGVQEIKALVNWHGFPLGAIRLPVYDGRCLDTQISTAVLDNLKDQILHRALQIQLSHNAETTQLVPENIWELPSPSCKAPLPSITVAVCTRSPVADIRPCLDSLTELDYPKLDFLVVDYNPDSSDVEKAICTDYPHIRYVHEPRPGLNWARNTAAQESHGEVIAYVSDRSTMNPNWAMNIGSRFAESPEVMIVTGLVVQASLDTNAQTQFEGYGGFGLGYERKWFHTGKGKPLPKELVAHPKWLGTDTNMAIRQIVFEKIGYFDPALATKPNLEGAGALDLFCRSLKDGHVLLYEPAAIAYHYGMQAIEDLEAYYRRTGSEFVYILKNALRYSDERKTALSIGLWWIRTRIFMQFILAFLGHSSLPRDLAFAKASGGIRSMITYVLSSWSAARIERRTGLLTQDPLIVYKKSREEKGDLQYRTAVRSVEITSPVMSLEDVADYDRTRIIVTWQGAGIGQVYIWNHRRMISAPRLQDAIESELGYRLFDPDQQLGEADFYARLTTFLAKKLLPRADDLKLSSKLLQPTTFSSNTPVSVIICTCDRPKDLRRCLTGLTQQDTKRSFEIIVVDNRPGSGLTSEVVLEFPQVKLIHESRPGASYARNAGIVVSQHEIIAMLDDDTSVPSTWLENLLVPFKRPEVMAVTGNVLPVELETASQRLFESYGDGGLGRGFERFEAGADWFHSKDVVRTWLLGGTANIACRTSLFANPQVGLLDEALGPGMPSGVGEDIYFFYKILKAGHIIAYEPTAFVWHTHRRDMPALRRQLYNYSKGQVSYHLTLLIQHQDWRSMKHLFVTLPFWHVGRIVRKLQRQSRYPISLVLLEAFGNLAGPWSLWMSRQRVQHLGHSQPYVLPIKRNPIKSAVSEVPQNTFTLS